MKSMTKLMVVAMLLVAALVVAPAAAREGWTNPTNDEVYYNITSGDTIFAGEEHLNISALFGGEKNGRLVHFSDPSTGAADKIIEVADAHDFELIKTTVGSTTGTYYAFNKSGDPIGAIKGDERKYVVVDIPKVTLDVVLDNSRTDSVDGKSVTRDNVLAFKLQNNLAGAFSDDKYAPQMKIEVYAPGGGTLTKFGDVKLDDVRLNKSTIYVENITLADEEAGAYTAQAKWYAGKNVPGSSFYDKGYDSNTVTWEILTKKLTISSNKDTVVRDKSFTVTVVGESKKEYYLWVKKAGNLEEDEYPWIAEGQPSVKIGTVIETDGLKDITPYKGQNATIETNAAGKRDVRFETSPKTDDRQFTIRVQDPDKPGTYDEVKVRVEKGAVSITASGTGVYFIGEEITLSGTCTDSDTVYLFLTGPNLPSRGVKLDDPTTDGRVETGEPESFTTEDVEADDTWTYKWDTGALEAYLDAGGYTVYAVSQPVDKDDLADAEYDTAAVTLKSAFITATSSGATVAKGDDLKITGVAQGDPSSVYVWIFGKNFRKLGDSATVESDGSFEYELKGGETKDLSAGQYFVVVQHPMFGGSDVKVSDKGVLSAPGLGKDANLNLLQASDAANALIQALDSPYVDDTYVKLTFSVEEPYIFIDPIGDKEAGSKFTITGTTNVAVGDKLIIDVTSAAFGPSKKTEASGFGAVSGNVVVEKGDGANKWSFEVDAADLKPDQYIVKVECIETDTTNTANFNLVEKVETTPTTVTTTAPAVETTTTAPAGETTTEPTPTPGFGALVALAGLGAVAFLVLRRK